jgi:hypothetical protein
MRAAIGGSRLSVQGACQIFSCDKNAATLLSLRFAFKVLSLQLKQLCLNILGSF